MKPEQAVMAGIAQLYGNNKLSDFTITCGQGTYRVHKFVISLQSDFFKAAISNGFKAATDAQIDLKIDLNDPSCDNPEAVTSMIRYLYFGNYDANTTSEADLNGGAASNKRKRLEDLRDDDGNMLAHSRVVAIAVKYGIPALRDLAAYQFRTAIRNNWNDRTLALTVREVYTSTEEHVTTLRNIVALSLHSHKNLYLKKEVGDAIKSIDGLAFDLLKLSRGLYLEQDVVDSSSDAEDD